MKDGRNATAVSPGPGISLPSGKVSVVGPSPALPAHAPLLARLALRLRARLAREAPSAVAGVGAAPAEMDTSSEEDDVDTVVLPLTPTVSYWAPEMYGTKLSTTRSILWPDGSSKYSALELGQWSENPLNIHNRPKLIIDGL